VVTAVCASSASCAQGVFVCFVLISVQTAIISLYRFHRLVYVTETESAYCVVRADSSNVVQVKEIFKELHL